MEPTRIEQTQAPYPGLRPFLAEESDIFFGRERQTDQLLARLAAGRFLAVVGPSGCGKSSLVAAGLLPALATGFMVRAGSHWQIASFRPGGRPMRRLAEALVALGLPDRARAEGSDAAAYLEAALRRGPRSLVEIVRGSELPADANLLVLVDQFEELFRYAASDDREEVHAFVSLLLATASAPDERIYVVLTMRSDFLGDCAPYQGLPEAINAGLFLTPRLTRDEAAACIRGPARVFEADVAPGLVNRLLNDFGPDPDQLPLLQHALMRMWASHQEDRLAGRPVVLDVPEYERIGGLDHALSRHADDVLTALSPDDQGVAEQMFRRLSDCETGRRDQRAPAPVGEIAALAGVDPRTVIRVADAFRRPDRCFLTPRADVPLNADSVLDVSHESLLRKWDSAKRWIADEAEGVVLYRQLVAGALEWRRGQGALLLPPKLDRALAWHERTSERWARRYGKEGDFEAVSAWLDESGRAWEQGRRQRRRARWQRVGLVGLATVVLAGAIGGLGYYLGCIRPHVAHFSANVYVWGAPRGIGRPLTDEQLRHRELSFRITTAGWWGRTTRMEVVNSRDELTEVAPLYKGMGRGRNLNITTMEYSYEPDGSVASERQLSRSGRLVQRKFYLPSDDRRERRAIFVGPDWTPTPVSGPSGDASPYWAELIAYTPEGYEEQTTYLGPFGEPVPGPDYAFGTAYQRDERGNVIQMTSLDEKGNPMNDSAGNARLSLKLGPFGTIVEARAFDEGNRPTYVTEGWSIQHMSTDDYGNVTEMAYFDEAGQPVVGAQGWQRVTLARDADGRVRERRYYDGDSPTTESEERCFGHRLAYDAQDHVTRWTCLGPDGQPTSGRQGYQATDASWDGDGQLVELAYLDATGHLVPGQDAYARIHYTRDDEDRLSSVDYFGADGERVTGRDGHTGYRVTTSDHGRTERTTYLDRDGAVAFLENGYSILEQKRDLLWNVVEERYLQDGDWPSRGPSGVFGWRGTYDALGQQIEGMYLGRGREVISSGEGFAGWTRDYDPLGREIATRYLGPNGAPVSVEPLGIAGWRSTVDRWGNEIWREYQDPSGHRAATRQGEAGWRATYDRWGRRTELTYLDTQGQPTLHGGGKSPGSDAGCVSLRRTFDAWGQVRGETCHDAQGELTLNALGWARVVHEVDERGNKVLTTYYGVDDKPTKLPRGYSAVARRFDARGRVLEYQFYDTDQKTPVNLQDGGARQTMTYDRRDQVVEVGWFDATGGPSRGPDGPHRTVTHRDASGRLTDEERFDSAQRSLGKTELAYAASGAGVVERHLDGQGQLVETSEEPCATLEYACDVHRHLTETRCLDARGRPKAGLDGGAARIEYRYDELGELTTQTSVRANGARSDVEAPEVTALSNPCLPQG